MEKQENPGQAIFEANEKLFEANKKLRSSRDLWHLIAISLGFLSLSLAILYVRGH